MSEPFTHTCTPCDAANAGVGRGLLLEVSCLAARLSFASFTRFIDEQVVLVSVSCQSTYFAALVSENTMPFFIQLK